VAVVLAHGAGSSAAAARELLGLELHSREIIPVEDRTGDVEVVVDLITTALSNASEVTHLVGVSLGAHAVASWAARSHAQAPAIVCVLPAWTGLPDATASLTSLSAADIGRDGVLPTLRRIRQDSPNQDIAEILEAGWSDYSQPALVNALQMASRSWAPDDAALTTIAAPSTVVGWSGDPLHPVETARRWARNLPRARIAIAVRPDVALLRAAFRAATGLGPTRVGPQAAVHPRQWPSSGES
jgi:pimeloyl-ACP methyl ester carboxylesterase